MTSTPPFPKHLPASSGSSTPPLPARPSWYGEHMGCRESRRARNRHPLLDDPAKQGAAVALCRAAGGVGASNFTCWGRPDRAPSHKGLEPLAGSGPLGPRILNPVGRVWACTHLGHGSSSPGRGWRQGLKAGRRALARGHSAGPGRSSASWVVGLRSPSP